LIAIPIIGMCDMQTLPMICAMAISPLRRVSA
jgi:hypothetical protein